MGTSVLPLIYSFNLSCIPVYRTELMLQGGVQGFKVLRKPPEEYCDLLGSHGGSGYILMPLDPNTIRLHSAFFLL